MDESTSTPFCPVCKYRLVEALILDRSEPPPPPYLCYNCLSERPELRFFKAIPGARKMFTELSRRRAETAKELREQGLTYAAIGARFSVLGSAVQCWVKPDLARRSRDNERAWYANKGREAKLARRREYEADHPLYGTWICIRHRCYTPSADNYLDYGGRGIEMHPAWENNFAAFEAWINEHLGPRPEEHSLDRIDNDSGYAPGNVRWASRQVQQQNRRPLFTHAEAERLRMQLRAAGLDPCA